MVAPDLANSLTSLIPSTGSEPAVIKDTKLLYDVPTLLVAYART